MDDARVQALLDKQAIHEVVLRYCRGVDRLDMPLVRSCYHDDGVDHHTGFTGSADDSVAWIDGGLRRFTGTMHLIGNHLCQLQGETAYAETYGTARQVRAKEGEGPVASRDRSDPVYRR